MRTRYLVAALSALAVIAGVAVSVPGRVAAQADPAPGTKEYFTKKVQPILDANCYDCHAEETQKGNLRLDSYGAIQKGGKSGPILVAGDPETSRMILAIRRSGGAVKAMPPKNVLEKDDVAVLEAWVKAGAVGADGAAQRMLLRLSLRPRRRRPRLPRLTLRKRQRRVQALRRL